METDMIDTVSACASSSVFDYTDIQQTTRLAELLFPKVTQTPEDMEKIYPPRQLPEGAKVTRFAPSPTGFVHFGGLFPSTVGERLAHQSNGIFYLRIEDTDAKREVPGAAEGLINTLAHYGIHFDEGAILDADGKITDKGQYGPYKQSLRGPIYHVYAKDLVRRGLAYPCFSTEDELQELQETDKKAEIKSKEWTEAADKEQHEKMMAQRVFTLEEVEARLSHHDPFVIRILSNGNPNKKIAFTDLVRGAVDVSENDEDFVLLKSDGIPTYHFAHAVDDHLMQTTHVIRGEEWLPSLPKHIQLFQYLGFKLPKYLHISQIMRLDENGNKKKLSKRDMGANMDDYARLGYDPACVCEYIMTLLNSNYEEWHMQNPTLPYTDFPFSVKKMSSSGCLFDFDKLNDVSKNVISKMSATEVYDKVCSWSKQYDKDFYQALSLHKDTAVAAFSIGRGGKKPRKDLSTWADAKPYIGFFFDEFFAMEDSFPDTFKKDDIRYTLSQFIATYDANDDMNIWFDKIKNIAVTLGYETDMKLYKSNPDNYPGSIADISMFLRLAVTGKMNAPDMYTVMQILGRETVLSRMQSALANL